MTGKATNRKAAGYLLLAGVIVVCIVILEVASGILLANPALEARKTLLKVLLDPDSKLPAVINEKTDSKLSPHPYLLYRTTPGYAIQPQGEGGTKVMQHNALGYRSDEISVEKAPGVFRIMTLGGSTTYGVAIKNYQATWPHLLQGILNKDPPAGYDTVEVLNAGVSGYTSAEMLSAWMFRHQYMDADLVLIHTGGNDVYPLLYPDYDPEYLHYRARGLSLIVPMQDTLRSLVEVSNTIELLTMALVPTGALYPVYVSYPYPVQLLDPVDTLLRVESTYPEGFARNLSTLVRAIKGAGTPVAMMSFVQATDDWIEENDAGQRGRVNSISLGLEKNREVMRSIAAAHQVPYIEPTHTDFPNELFFDYCHLRKDGQIIKADIFANFLRNEQLFPGNLD
jgi:lysophospholipase L1-like esterase